MKKMSLALLFACSLVFSQVNTWQRVAVEDGIERTMPAFFYSAVTGEFVLTMGTQDESGTNVPYCVQVYKTSLGKWINALPNDTLYGKWADSTGVARNNGRCGNGVFGTYYWAFKSIEGYLRPNTGAYKTSRSYGQFAMNSDNGKAYFYINNSTFTYDPATRRWDTLSTAVHPNSGAVESALKWGSMCYDAHNQEILLCGGGAIDKDSSHLGTWTFKPSTGVWTELPLAVQPGPRANSSMAYDAQNHIIVLFGGDRLDSYYGDTWIYNCASKTWTQRHPSMNPKPRAGHSMVYLPKSKKVVLLGGYSRAGSPASAYEMWVYDYSGNAWSLIKQFSGTAVWPKSPGVKSPATGYSAADTGDFIVALGDTAPSGYYFHASVYRLQCDPAQIDAGGTSTYGIARDTMNWYSDNTPQDPSWYITGVTAPDTGANESFLRGLGLNKWYKLAPPKNPGGNHAWSSTILDPDRDQFLKFGGGHVAYCGTDVEHYNLHTNRWSIGYRAEFPLEYDGDNGCRPGPFTFNNRPFMNVHNTHAYDYDVNLHRMIYVGGAHTHIYNPDIMDYDKVHIHSTFGNGGYNTGLVQTPHGVACLYVSPSFATGVYLFNGGTMNWQRLTNSGAALPGFYADNSGVIYDSKRDRLIVVQGNSNATGALWSFSFATGVVTQLNATNSGIATGNDHYRDLVYLPHQDVVVWGIRQGAGHLAYDCAANAWMNYPIALDASVTNAAYLDDRGAGYMYDTKRNLVWVSDNSCGSYVMRPDAHFSKVTLEPLPEVGTGLSISPNPGNPEITLRFGGIWKQGAEVRIYDVRGALVANLGKTMMNQPIVWHANKAGSGVYVACVKKGAQIIRKSIILAR